MESLDACHSPFLLVSRRAEQHTPCVCSALDYRSAIGNQSSGDATEEKIEVAKKSHDEIQ